MLILTRRAGQSLKIGDNVFVHVLRMHDHRIEIGIEAPKEVPIYRIELLDHNGNPPPKEPK